MLSWRLHLFQDLTQRLFQYEPVSEECFILCHCEVRYSEFSFLSFACLIFNIPDLFIKIHIKGIVISLWCSPFKQNNILQVGKLFLLHSLHLYISNWSLWRGWQWWDAVTSPHLVPISPAVVKVLLDRNTATSLHHPQGLTPCWCLYLEPGTQDFHAMAHKPPLISR